MAVWAIVGRGQGYPGETMAVSQGDDENFKKGGKPRIFFTLKSHQNKTKLGCGAPIFENTAQNKLWRGVLRKNRPKHFAGNRFSKKTASNKLQEGVLQKKQLQTLCGKPFFKKNSFKQIAGSRSSKKTASNILRRGVLRKNSFKHFAAG
jgi:hypothetical protein